MGLFAARTRFSDFERMDMAAEIVPRREGNDDGHT
jgi:hypothetical protein